MLIDSCVICLTPKDDDFDKILTKNDSCIKLLNLGELYENVFNLEISKFNNCPEFMCSDCSLQLKLLTKLKKKATGSYEIIKSINGDNENIKSERLEPTGENSEKLILLKMADNLDDNSFILYEEDSQNKLKYNILELNDVQEFSSTEIITKLNDFNHINRYELSSTDGEGDNNNEAIMNTIALETDFEINETTKDTIITNSDEKLNETKNLDTDRIDDLIEKYIIEDSQSSDIDINQSTIETTTQTTYDCINKEYNVLENDLTRKNHFIEENQEIFHLVSDNDDDETLQNTNVNIELKQIKNPNYNFCKDCNEIFESRHLYAQHRRDCHLRVKLKCNQCNKVAFSEEALRVHYRIHQGLPAYECDMCSKTFKQKAHLIYHIQGHTNDLQVQCNLCPKKFRNKADLKCHIRCHLDERPYECDICQKRFRAYTHMTNHRYSHFGRTIECKFCNQKYASPSTLRTHIRTVHEDYAPYECELCKRSYKRKSHLISHLKSHEKKNKLTKDYPDTSVIDINDRFNQKSVENIN